MPAIAELNTIIIDCADPASLARFYASLTGWEITYSDEDYASLGDGPLQLAFQRIEGYQGPKWPDPAKHFHLDLKVPDLETAIKELLDLGATKPEFQPGDANWTVLADPEGHLFCLVPEK
jgi:predicted enzyme related to lactoylglutathione lyase